MEQPYLQVLTNNSPVDKTFTGGSIPVGGATLSPVFRGVRSIDRTACVQALTNNPPIDRKLTDLSRVHFSTIEEELEILNRQGKEWQLDPVSDARTAHNKNRKPLVNELVTVSP